MDDFWLTILCVLGFTLLMVMVVGHLLWVMAAAVLRALFGSDVPEPTPAQAPSQRAMLQAMRRQVRAWQSQGTLTAQQAQTLEALIERELRGIAPQAREDMVPPAASQVPPPRAVPGPPAAWEPRPAWGPPPAVEEEPCVVAELVEAPAAVPRTEVATVHPLDRRDEPPAVPSAAAVRPWSEVVLNFMEENNIRWGELLAAGLIVLCSIGLVISLRATLRQIPYFPVLLFTLFMLGLHSAGLYTLRKWNLQRVSRALLLISLLLVPLTFFAAVLLSSPQRGPPGGMIAALAAALVVSGWVAFSSSRTLVPDLAWPLAAGVLLCTVALAPIHSWQVSGTISLTLRSLLPLAGLAGVCGAALARLRQWRQLSRPRLTRLARGLGTILFAFLVPLVVLLAQQENRREALGILSPLLSVAAACLLSVFLLAWRQTTARTLADWRTATSAAALCAGIALLGLVAAAWPEPGRLILVSGMAGLILVGMGLVAELPLLWLPGILCLALASTLGLHLVTGTVPLAGQAASWEERSQELIEALLMARSSLWLSLLAVAVGLLSWRMPSAGPTFSFAASAPPLAAGDATPPADLPTETSVVLHPSGAAWTLVDTLHDPRQAWELASAVLGATSMSIALFAGFVDMSHWQWQQDRLLAGPLLLLQGLAVIFSGLASRQPKVTRLGSVLVWLAALQVLHFSAWGENWTAALDVAGNRLLAALAVASLLHGGLMAAISCLIAMWAERAVAQSVGQPASPQRQEPGPELFTPLTEKVGAFLARPLAETAAVSLGGALPITIFWGASGGLFWGTSSDVFGGVTGMVLAISGGWLLLMGQRGHAAWHASDSSSVSVALLGFCGWAAGQLAGNVVLLWNQSWQKVSLAPESAVILLCQVNALTAAALAAGWNLLSVREARIAAFRPQVRQELQPFSASWLWKTPWAVAGVCLVALGLMAGGQIFWDPTTSSLSVQQIGRWPSHLATGLALVAAVFGPGSLHATAQLLCPLATALVPLVAATAAGLEAGGSTWLAYHTLEVGWLVVALAVLGTGRWRLATAAPAGLTGLLVVLLVGLALRGNESDPQQPWWSLITLAGAAVLAAAAALLRRSQPWAWASWALAGLTTFIFCISPGGRNWLDGIAPTNLAPLVGGELIFMALVAAAGWWFAVERWWQRRGETLAPASRLPPAHGLALGLLVVCCLGWRWLYASLMAAGPPAASAYYAWTLGGTLALGLVLGGTLWDRRAWYALPAAYLWGLALWGMLVALGRDVILTQLGDDGLAGGVPLVGLLPGPTRPAVPEWAGELWMTLVCVGLALHAALSGQLWFYGANLAAWGQRWGVESPVEGLKRADRWLPVAQSVLTSAGCLAAGWLVFVADHLALRVIAACTPAVAAWGLACLAQGRRQHAMQLATLGVVGLSAVLLGWSEHPAVPSPAVPMHLTFRLLMVLCGLTFVYGLVLPQWLVRGTSWERAAQHMATAVAVLAGGVLLATVGWEVALFEPREGAPAASPQVLAVAVLMALGAAGLVALALLPGRDPLHLDQRRRQACVYAAEAVLVLLMAHLYLCRPAWFAFGLRPYWPLIVLMIAFAGAAAAEIAQRWQLAVLVEPLQRTGQWLPLLPVLGWWVVGSDVDYAVLLLAAGLLYLVLSWRWRSWACGVAAAVAGNAALWRWYSDQDLTLASNPQLWLVPPAFSLLVAAQWHRQQLSPDLLAAIRYAATLVIYVSSTSEIMIGGFAHRLWPPMVLLVLAVFGALMGIALRVRAFLILGTAFTFVALLAMVRHAAQAIGHVWPWWVLGIALGVAILTVLGLFEKKRAAWERAVRELSHWDK